jgi:hypothetical protein
VGHFYLHLRDHIDELLDDEGCVFGSMDELRAHVLTTVRDLMSGDLARGIIDLRYRIDVENALGEIVYTLPFKHAVNIIPE